MEKIMTIGVVIVMLLAGFLFGRYSSSNGAKYQIILDPNRRPYLLDPQMGRVWQYTKEADGNVWFWHEMPKDSLNHVGRN